MRTPLQAKALLLAFVIIQARADDVLTLSSPTLQEDGFLAEKNGGNIPSNPNCSGQNISPPLSWAHAPSATRSFAILMVDPEGRRGLGVNHWVAYGISATLTGFAEGEVGQPSAKHVHGI